MLALTGTPAERPAATGLCRRGPSIDHATALLWFPQGISATLTASTVSHERLRCGRFYTRDCQYVVDFANRQLTLYRYGKSSYPRTGGEQVQTQQMSNFPSRIASRWRWSRSTFFQAIRSGTPPATDAGSARAALQLALALQAEVNAQLVTRS